MSFWQFQTRTARVVLLATTTFLSSIASSGAATSDFRKDILPIIQNYCSDCHLDGSSKGDVAFDKYKSDEDLVGQHALWWKVLKNVRAGTMPPKKKDQPTKEEAALLEAWIKEQAFGIDPANPDPGRVTLRRLNRNEYANTIRDLMGIEFRADEEFPPDDTGYGFDNIGDVLSISPLLLEKYMEAAETIVARAVPTVSRAVTKQPLPGRSFRAENGGSNGDRLDFYQAHNLKRTFKIEQPGEYRVVLDVRINGSFDHDPAESMVTIRLDEEDLLHEKFGWQNGLPVTNAYTRVFQPGEHTISFKLDPLVEDTRAENMRRFKFVNLRINDVTIQGPLDEKRWTAPPNYGRFFTRSEPPKNARERRAYAREVLQRFASKAFRRPADKRTLDRLAAIAEEGYNEPGNRFEEGVARAMVATLASPRFVFRVEEVVPNEADNVFARIDDYALASRLSYFIWSTMPDDQLLDLAAKGALRKELATQVKRMLNDSKAQNLVENFTGQWLQVRDVEGITINVRAMARGGSRRDRVELDGELRRAMREESEALFEHIMEEDRSVLEFLDADYTFLNERLARHYEIEGVEGNQMRKVKLPADSPRGGVLTQGATLVVTSNPTRTSPVKRGLFVLENILGSPTPPPPPDIPELEEAAKQIQGRTPSLRETLALHREKPLCSSCHNRMDPLGLALENFNALGMWRTEERGEKIDAAGELITGEQFQDVRDLKKALKESRKRDFYQCLTEKLMTYALGRGVEYYDTHTVDQIVEQLDRSGGKFSTLLMGIIESAPFQKRRNASTLTAQANLKGE